MATNISLLAHPAFTYDNGLPSGDLQVPGWSLVRDYQPLLYCTQQGQVKKVSPRRSASRRAPSEDGGGGLGHRTRPSGMPLFLALALAGWLDGWLAAAAAASAPLLAFSIKDDVYGNTYLVWFFLGGRSCVPIQFL